MGSAQVTNKICSLSLCQICGQKNNNRVHNKNTVIIKVTTVCTVVWVDKVLKTRNLFTSITKWRVRYLIVLYLKIWIKYNRLYGRLFVIVRNSDVLTRGLPVSRVNCICTVNVENQPTACGASLWKRRNCNTALSWPAPPNFPGGWIGHQDLHLRIKKASPFEWYSLMGKTWSQCLFGSVLVYIKSWPFLAAAITPVHWGNGREDWLLVSAKGLLITVNVTQWH